MWPQQVLWLIQPGYFIQELTRILPQNDDSSLLDHIPHLEVFSTSLAHEPQISLS